MIAKERQDLYTGWGVIIWIVITILQVITAFCKIMEWIGIQWLFVFLWPVIALSLSILGTFLILWGILEIKKMISA